MNLKDMKIGASFSVKADAKKAFEDYKKLHPKTKKTIKDFEQENKKPAKKDPHAEHKEFSEKMEAKHGKDFTDNDSTMSDEERQHYRKLRDAKEDSLDKQYWDKTKKNQQRRKANQRKNSVIRQDD